MSIGCVRTLPPSDSACFALSSTLGTATYPIQCGGIDPRSSGAISITPPMGVSCVVHIVYGFAPLPGHSCVPQPATFL
jgi:hypothetical protein